MGQYSIAWERIINEFDEATNPSRLSREDYKELLGNLIDELEIRLETAEQEDGE